jgi:hypothetical protein
LGEAGHPVDLLAEAAEKVVAGLGIVLRPGLQHLDRSRDAGERIAKLVGGVGDELSLGQLPPHLVGAVPNHHQHRLLGGQIAGLERVDAIPNLQGGDLCTALLGGAPQMGNHRRRRPPILAGQRCRRRIGEADRAVVVDHQHRIGEAIEDRSQSVAVRREDLEAMAQGRPHLIQGPGQIGDLVGAGSVDRRVQRPSGHLLGAARQPLDPVGDRGGHQEADQDGDQETNGELGGPIGHRGLARIAAQQVPRAGGNHPHRDEGSAEPEPHADPWPGAVGPLDMADPSRHPVRVS